MTKSRKLVPAEVAVALARNKQAPGPLNTLKLSMLYLPLDGAGFNLPLVPVDPPGPQVPC